MAKQTILFKVAPEYTVAHSYTQSDCITLDEWIGRSVEDFTKAMGRSADYVTSETIHGRKIKEYRWEI